MAEKARQGKFQLRGELAPGKWVLTFYKVLKRQKVALSMAESQPGAGHEDFGIFSPVTHFYQP